MDLYFFNWRLRGEKDSWKTKNWRRLSSENKLYERRRWREEERKGRKCLDDGGSEARRFVGEYELEEIWSEIASTGDGGKKGRMEGKCLIFRLL